ncbi:MAG: hypothetical protein P1U90_05325 [Akkermansiaceae bacterium]|nr:hypothetical protein [Akkermansiaceae bacterium]
MKAEQHINMPEGMPLANLWLMQAKMMGAKMKRFADSAGEIGAVKAWPAFFMKGRSRYLAADR